MSDDNLIRANEQTKVAWNHNAAYWDARMGEGNDYVELLSWPATERLLAPQPGERLLDIACGNGLTSRRIAALGAEVVAFDFSTDMIAHARDRGSDESRPISYQVIDATDAEALLRLGEGGFDAAHCGMALFDIAHIEPLMNTLPRLLRPAGRFVFSIVHPCFNNPHMAHVAEMEDRAGQIVTTYSVKISGYMTPSIAPGVALPEQAMPHLYFHRPLQDLFGVAFKAGFILDGLEERAFPADHPAGKNPLSWSGSFSEIPPVLVARMRLN